MTISNYLFSPTSASFYIRIFSSVPGCKVFPKFKQRFITKLATIVLFLLTKQESYCQFSKSPLPDIRAQVSLNPALKPFYHGVASFDPTSEEIIIWTRVTPDSSMSEIITVNWRIAADTGMFQQVAAGVFTTDSSKDFTVKVNISGLQPNTFYYYEFYASGRYSIKGRTKTAPSGDFDSLRLAIVSCAHFEKGYFNAYAAIKQRNDIDAVIHLGDYIYEGKTSGGTANPNTPERIWEPQTEAISLPDYRTRYAFYRLDPDLMAIHQQYPFIPVWDDHESANDAYKDGAKNHDTLTEGSWTDRKAAAVQAYNEWLPVRLFDPANLDKIWRKISYGNLADIFLLDTRLWGREIQNGTTDYDTSRTILAPDQLNWLLSGLENLVIPTSAQWNIVAQQVMMAPLRFSGTAVNPDQWDGYPAEREKIFNHILNNFINDVVVLTGDIHTSWASDLPGNNYDSLSGAGSAGVEFVVTGVTNGSSYPEISQQIINQHNPHIKYSNMKDKGYLILDVNKIRTQADWYFVQTVNQRLIADSFGMAKQTIYGSRHLSDANNPSIARDELTNSIQAPEIPLSIPSENATAGIIITGVYPNPSSNQINIQLYIPYETNIKYHIYDIVGKIVHEQGGRVYYPGFYKEMIDISGLPPGAYIIEIGSFIETRRHKIIIKK